MGALYFCFRAYLCLLAITATKDAAADLHGLPWQAAILLLLRDHCYHNVLGLAAG